MTEENKTTKTETPPEKKLTPKKDDTMTNKELASEIVMIVSQELHARTGIGPIWRQLNDGRKKEIISKWEGDIEKFLKKNR